MAEVLEVKVKDKDFLLFQKWFTYYQKLFGLTGYKVYFKYEPIPDAFADINCDLDGMCATVRLNSTPTKEDKPFKHVKQSALHECCHLLVARLADRARSRYLNEWELDEAIEELVRKLEGLLK